MSREIDPHAAVDYILANAGKFAKAKAERVYLEEFRKSKKALLMKASPESSGIAQERDAYAHEDYIALLVGLKEAVLIEEKLKWDLIAAQARVEIYRTQEASNRMMDRAVR
jgi:hypothetical protein